MKKDIHPKVNMEAVVTCVCGNKFTTISTANSLQVDICSQCHPFFTGTQKLIDTEGRIDKFNKKLAQTTQKKEKAATKVKVAKVEPVKAPQRGNLKDILKQLKDDEKASEATTATETPKEQ